MSDLGNKDIFSKNLKRYIEESGKDRRELAEIWGFPYSTVTEWINAKKYPRIDKVEIMANYFGILKSDLIEDKTAEHKEMQKNNDTIASIIVRLRTDSEFLKLVEALNSLDGEKVRGVKQMLFALMK